MKKYIFMFFVMSFACVNGRMQRLGILGMRALSSSAGKNAKIVQAEVMPRVHPAFLDEPVAGCRTMNFHNCDVKLTVINAPDNKGTVGGTVLQSAHVDNSVTQTTVSTEKKPWWRQKDFWVGAAAGSGVGSVVTWIACHLPFGS